MSITQALLRPNIVLKTSIDDILTVTETLIKVTLYVYKAISKPYFNALFYHFITELLDYNKTSSKICRNK